MIIVPKNKQGFLWVPDLSIGLSIMLIGFLIYAIWIEPVHIFRDSFFTIGLALLLLLRILWLTRWFKREKDVLYCNSIFQRKKLNAKDCAVESSLFSTFNLFTGHINPSFLRFREKNTMKTAFIGYSLYTPTPKYFLHRIESAVKILEDPTSRKYEKSLNEIDFKLMIVIFFVGIIVLAALLIAGNLYN